MTLYTCDFIAHGEAKTFGRLVDDKLSEGSDGGASLIDVKLSANEGQYLALIIWELTANIPNKK